MDFETAYSQLVTIIRAGEGFPAGHNHLDDHEANMQAARDLAETSVADDLRYRIEQLEAELAAIDERAAAEQRLRALGASPADIEKLKAR